MPLQPNTLPHHAADALAQQIDVVLVRPLDSLNIGSVARAMDNLGFSDLHLVTPQRFDIQRAEQSACWASPLIHKAQVHNTLEAAIADAVHVVGFTARHGQHRSRHVLLPEWLSLWKPTLPQSKGDNTPAKTALLFGSEDHGLHQEALNHCHYLIRIPSHSANPAYNLAQAVLLTLYGLRMQWDAAQQFEQPSHFPSVAASSNKEIPAQPPTNLEQQAAPAKALLQLDQLIVETLTRSQFYKQGTPAPVPGLVRRMFRRIEPNLREWRILMGIFGKINQALQGKIPIAHTSTDQTGLQSSDSAPTASQQATQSGHETL